MLVTEVFVLELFSPSTPTPRLQCMNLITSPPHLETCDWTLQRKGIALNMEGAAKFHHPYEPYDIQLQFMRTLYECIDQGKVGIFESPTGG